MMRPVLTLDQANRILTGVMAAATESGAKPLAAVVLDESGNIVASQRQDGASMFRHDIAVSKAWGAVAFGVSSRALAEKARNNPSFMQALSATAAGRLLPNPGALTIQDASGVVLGAVGVSGDKGDHDEALAASGIASAGLARGE